MSFGREASPWGVRVQAVADEAGRRLRGARERVADRAWYSKHDLLRGCRSAWVLGRARARLRIEAFLWWTGVVRQRMDTGPARMALGASLTLLVGALLAAAFVALSDEGGSAGHAPQAQALAEGAVAGQAQKPAAGDVAPAGNSLAAAGPPVSPASPSGVRVGERPALPGSPPAAPQRGRGLERSSPAPPPPSLLDRRPTTVLPGAPNREPAAGPVAPAPAPMPAPPAREKPEHPAAPPPAREKPNRPDRPPPAQEKPERPAQPPPAQEKPDRPAQPPPAQEKPKEPAAPPPGQSEREHPHSGPPGQQKEKGSPGQEKKEDSPGHGNGHQGRPDRP